MPETTCDWCGRNVNENSPSIVQKKGQIFCKPLCYEDYVSGYRRNKDENEVNAQVNGGSHFHRHSREYILETITDMSPYYKNDGPQFSIPVRLTENALRIAAFFHKKFADMERVYWDGYVMHFMPYGTQEYLDRLQEQIERYAGSSYYIRRADWFDGLSTHTEEGPLFAEDWTEEKLKELGILDDVNYFTTGVSPIIAKIVDEGMFSEERKPVTDYVED